MGRLLGRIVVGLTTSLICFIAYSSQLFVIWPWYGRVVSVELLTLLVPFNLLVAMLLWNYYLCVVTDPGRVPDGWRPDMDSMEGYEVKKLTGSPRYCKTCDQYKPPRSHHCRQCKRCVLRMDHHCPWVNNCVGHFNYGHFIRFLLYVDVACSYHLAMVTRRVIQATRSRIWDVPEGTELVFIILNYVACIPVLLMVGGFSLYHFYCLLANSTTIEGWEKDKVATLVRRGKIRDIKFPYSLGKRRNIESVLGTNPWLWCWPTRAPGTGLKYQLAEGDGIEHQEVWPPRDPSTANHQFTLPDSPWTYENNSFNPSLNPSNSQLRSTASAKSKRRRAGGSSVPPWHPDYQDGDENQGVAVDHDSLASSDDGNGYDDDGAEYGYGKMGGILRMRRGSEGYEVRPVDREEILRRYIESRGEEAGRYRRYEPEPPSEPEGESSEGEDVPLVRIIPSATVNGTA